MKRINKLTVNNFKFFVGEESLDFGCKNVLVYGENGSGKSSLYWALYTFLQSSLKKEDEIEKYFDKDNSENLINRFIDESETENVSVSLELKDENGILETFKISKELINTNLQSNTEIKKANATSDFINYKLLSRFYDFRNSEDIDIWELFEKEILEYITIEEKNLKNTWDILKNGLEKIDNKYPAINSQTYKDFEKKLENFNDNMNEFILQIIQNTNLILKENFKENLSISLYYKDTTYNNFVEESTTKRDHLVKNPQIILKAKFNNKDIDKPHTFLNEAKLTAIALSLRFSILKTRLVGDDILKILVLDDLLISLDMSHRLEVINIILNDEDLQDYQKIILTHDRGFFNLLNQKISYLDWKIFEFYNQNEKQCIQVHKTEIDRAKELFENNDFEASANYLRKETENILKNFLDPNLKYINKEFIGLENLLKRIKNELEEQYKLAFAKLFKFKDFDEALLSKIDTDFENDETLESDQKGKLRGFNKKLLKFSKEYYNFESTKLEIFDELKIIKDRVLNPLSHKSEAPIFRQEVEDAIDLIDRLKEFLKDKESDKKIERPQINCTKYSNNIEPNIGEDLGTFVINFTEDILDKLIEIKSSDDLNHFLENSIKNNIKNFTFEEFEKIFNKFVLPNIAYHFTNDSTNILKDIFRIKEWTLEERKIWCNFLRNLDDMNMNIDFFQWFENRDCLKINYSNSYGQEFWIDCTFLDDETPF